MLLECTLAGSVHVLQLDSNSQEVPVMRNLGKVFAVSSPGSCSYSATYCQVSPGHTATSTTLDVFVLIKANM